MYTIQMSIHGYRVSNGVTGAEVKTKKAAKNFIKILKKYGRTKTTEQRNQKTR